MREYLLANPTVEREEVKNGKVHYLARIDASGSPVYRVTRGGIETQKKGVGPVDKD